MYSLSSLLSPNDSRQELWAKQREERGFDDTETWALDSTIVKFVLPRLKRFQEVNIGFPGHLTMDQFRAIIDKMIAAFEMLDKRDDHPDTWDSKVINEGLQLFSQYFLDLWW